MKQNYVLCTSLEGFHNMVYSEWEPIATKRSTVICVHGFARNRHDFDPLAKFLSEKGHAVFCPDIVGRGDSTWFNNAKHYNYQQYAIDLNTLIARTNSKYIDWIGTSMGGILGMVLASLPNSPIRNLILNDVGPQLPVHTLWRLSQYIDNHPYFKNFIEAKSYLKKIYHGFGSLNEEQWDYITKHSIMQCKPKLYTVKLDPHIKPAKPSSQFMKELFMTPHKAFEGILFDIDLWDMWKNIRCPVLVIHGQNSDLLLNEHIEKMQVTHPSVTVMEIMDAGHAPVLFEQDQHEKITKWLAANATQDETEEL